MRMTLSKDEEEEEDEDDTVVCAELCRALLVRAAFGDCKGTWQC